MKRSTEEIKRAARAAGSYYFSPDTTRFFNSRTTDHTYDAGRAGTVLLISDRFEDMPRRYRPVLSLPDGRVEKLLGVNDGPTDIRRGKLLCALAAQWLREGMSPRGVEDRLTAECSESSAESDKRN